MKTKWYPSSRTPYLDASSVEGESDIILTVESLDSNFHLWRFIIALENTERVCER